MSANNQFDASGSLAGYLYQCRLALLLGLREVKRKPNSHMSIEKFDDIAFHDSQYANCIIQAKHHIGSKELSDTSVDVWKTIRIWVDQFKSGTITSADTKRILITTSSAQTDSAMAKLRAGNNPQDRISARTLLQNAATNSTNKSSESGRQVFLNLTDKEIDVLLSTITIIDQSPNLHDVMAEIEGELRLLAPNNADKVAEALEGWWLGVVAKRLIGEENVEIPVQHIAIKAQELGLLFGPSGLPVSSAEDLGDKAYHPDDEAENYVKQMRLIKLPQTAIQRGIRDFYRSNAQRSRWARENLLLDGEVSKYEANLKDQWERRFDAECCEAVEADDNGKCAMGKKVFFWASQHQVGFRNVVETWITAGTFHSLADRIMIGWHPDYDNHFSVGGDDEEA